MRLKQLTTLASVLLFSLSSCSKNQEPVQQIPEVHAQTAKYVIVSIDEDAFAILSYTYSGNEVISGVGEFQYEILRVRTQQDSIKKVFVPHPTELVVGDTIPEFKPASKITLYQITQRYPGRYKQPSPIIGIVEWPIKPLQTGTLYLDGILERN